jgi:hypothetical protein
MAAISKSPDRGIFGMQGRARSTTNLPPEKTSEVVLPPELLAELKTAQEQRLEQMQDPEWQRDNLEYDLLSTDWILERVRTDQAYAQNLYAGLCNNDFTKNEPWPILKDQRWSCSWRHAGGIIADMQQKGDYIDWYCSGIRSNDPLSDEVLDAMTPEKRAMYEVTQQFVGEGEMTDEIRADLLKLGWLVAVDIAQTV